MRSIDRPQATLRSAEAVSIGESPEGLPIGAQLIAAPFADPVCLRLARWLETEYRGFVAPPMALT